MTGTLTLNGQGNPNSVFIFNIGSTLTTASASQIQIINGANGGNVFFRVGSSATLGTTTAFAGEILALSSITLQTGATINCGSALAQNGAVTLDTNVINVCTTGAAAGVILPPAEVLPPTIPGNVGGIAAALNPNALPPGFLDLLLFLSPSELPAVLMQLNGELGTGAAQAGIQSMNSFLSLVTNPFLSLGTGQFGDSRFGPPPSRHPLIYKEPVYKAVHGATSDRRWNIWAAGYGGQNDADGNEVIGSHDRTVRGFGFATGLDYRIMPDTLVGFALAGGGTKFGLADAFGSGHSDMFQAAIYGLTRFDAAYLSAAVAYAWHHVSTDRVLSLVNFDYLTADFSANNIAGRIEGGYRFALPGVFGLPGFGFTPTARCRRRPSTRLPTTRAAHRSSRLPIKRARRIRPVPSSVPGSTRPSCSATTRRSRCVPAPPGPTITGPTRASPPCSSRSLDRASP